MWTLPLLLFDSTSVFQRLDVTGYTMFPQFGWSVHAQSGNCVWHCAPNDFIVTRNQAAGFGFKKPGQVYHSLLTISLKSGRRQSRDAPYKLSKIN